MLVPLYQWLSDLRLSYLTVGVCEAMWPLLCLAKALKGLELSKCGVSQGGLLLLVGRQLPGLRNVDVADCSGVSGASAVALAGMRVEPLCVRWTNPAPDGGQQLEFRALARAGVVLEVV